MRSHDEFKTNPDAVARQTQLDKILKEQVEDDPVRALLSELALLLARAQLCVVALCEKLE